MTKTGHDYVVVRDGRKNLAITKTVRDIAVVGRRCLEFLNVLKIPGISLVVLTRE